MASSEPTTSATRAARAQVESAPARLRSKRSKALLRIACLLAFLLLLAPGDPALSEGGDTRGQAIRDPVSLLLVQSARSLRYEDGKLTLKDVSPVTLFFLDSPRVMEGFLPHDDFEEMWAEGWNRYAADPPNATLQILEPPAEGLVTIELMGAAFEGDDLIYEVRVLEGSLPPQSGSATLFIDDYVWIPPDRGPQGLGWIRCRKAGIRVPQCYSDW